ncbi:hypothetical protein KNP414_02000 [Paenibacillus mucilaginosus KNP414]|uniref:Uncharacterized protein n=1 Tax=Paenibacillus mucilaginosus (strain KNP414) TaxID=1036673 RepID=F8FRK4_PAEMK|nr:hypothetical protein KNP414_02000 [Paenibacillus mucilaginosus KNP414]
MLVSVWEAGGDSKLIGAKSMVFAVCIVMIPSFIPGLMQQE